MKIFILIILNFLFTVASSHLLLETLSSIVLDNFKEKCDTIALISNENRRNSESERILSFLSVLQKSEVPIFYYKTSNLTTKFNYIIRCTIFHANYTKNIDNFVNDIDRQNFRIGGYFVVVFERNFNDSQIEFIFKKFWDKQIFNVATAQIKNDSITLSTFQPFELDCKNLKIVKLCELQNGQIHPKFCDLFPRKFKNLHSCPIRISIARESQSFTMIVKELTNGTFDLQGRDGNIINTLSSHLNFVPSISAVSDDVFLNNGTGIGPLQEMFNGSSEIVIGSYWLKLARANLFDVSVSQDEDRMIILVPHGHQLTSTEKLIYPFALEIWIMILCMSSIAFFSIHIMSKVKSKIAKEIFFGQKFSEISKISHYMNFIAFTIGDSSKQVPIYTFGRIILSTLLLSTIVLRSAYQGVFFQVMTNDVKFKEIETIKKIYDKNYTIYSSRWYVDIVESHDILRHLKLKVIQLKDQPEMFAKNLTDENFKGVIIEHYYGSIQWATENDSVKKLKFCKEKLHKMDIVNYMKKDFYLSREINLIIRRLNEGGIIQFWFKPIKERFEKDFRPEPIYPKILNYHHVEGCFKLLLSGIILSCIAFLFEIMLKNCSFR